MTACSMVGISFVGWCIALHKGDFEMCSGKSYCQEAFICGARSCRPWFRKIGKPSGWMLSWRPENKMVGLVPGSELASIFPAEFAKAYTLIF